MTTFQHYDPANASRTLRFKESQAPIVLGAWHREWGPGVHSTLLAGRLQSDVRTRHQAVIPDLRTNIILELDFAAFTNAASHADFTAYFTELNQVWQTERHVSIVGGGFQAGNFDVVSQVVGPADEFTRLYYGSSHVTRLDEGFARWSLYGYHTWEPWDRFRITGGLTYDRLTYPLNFRSALLSDERARREMVSPKAALNWDLLPGVTLRGMFARSLGGLVYDESVRLEPTQLAGFIQTYRNPISEAEAGSTSAARNQVGA